MQGFSPLIEPSFWSNLADLGIMLALICVPLATWAILVPVGRALAERIRADTGALSPTHGQSIAERLAHLEALTAAIGRETERLSEQQRVLARFISDQSGAGRSALTGQEGRVITPH